MKKEIKELKVLSGLAIIMVLLIHTNSFYVRRVLESSSYINQGWEVNFLDTLIWGAVPIFIFISGYKYFAFEKDLKYRNYVIKKAKKVIKPFLIITFIFIIYKNKENLSLIIVLQDLLKAALGSNFAYQLWYIPMYLFCIISYPKIYRHIKRDKFRIILLGSISVITIILGIRMYPFKFIYYLVFF